MSFIITFILGAIWRRVDGSTHRPKGWNIYIFLLPTSIFYLMYGYPNYVLCLFVSIAILDGFKDWNDWNLMATHFSKYTAIGMILSQSESILYLLISIVAGLCYPAIMRLKLPKWMGDNNWYCEIISGGLLIGGLTLM